MPKFEVVSDYQPSGDQPEAIAALAEGIENGLKEQILLGVTGSGKTFTMAKVIEKIQRPTLVLAHNKTLAAQLCAEFKEFFPNNAVEYFVSYYDYYQPEAYIPHTDTYIAKDASTNDEIDRLRLSATCALLERRDVIVVSSVSCIYGLGEPDDFAKLVVSLRVGAEWDRDELLRRLVEIRYERNDIAFERNMFRVRGDTRPDPSPHLRQRHVALVHEEHEVIRKEVQQRHGRGPGGPVGDDAGVVLNAGAVAQLRHHLHVVLRPLADALGFHQLVIICKELDLFLQLPADLARWPCPFYPWW